MQAHKQAVFLGQVRHKGKVLFAWEELPYGGHQTPEVLYNELVEIRQAHVPNYFAVTCTGSCSYTIKVGQVTPEPVPANVRFRDGYHGALPGQVLWLF